MEKHLTLNVYIPYMDKFWLGLFFENNEKLKFSCRDYLSRLLQIFEYILNIEFFSEQFLQLHNKGKKISQSHHQILFRYELV